MGLLISGADKKSVQINLHALFNKILDLIV